MHANIGPYILCHIVREAMIGRRRLRNHHASLLIKEETKHKVVVSLGRVCDLRQQIEQLDLPVMGNKYTPATRGESERFDVI
jgi:hypothetical protein